MKNGLVTGVWVAALMLAAAMGCTSEEGDGGNNAGSAGVTGAVGGVAGGQAGTSGGIGGAAGGGAGTTGGAAGVMGGDSGGMAGVNGGVGGVNGGGIGGGLGGEGGSVGGNGGAGGEGGGSGDPVATCIADAAANGRTGACAECGCMKCLAEIMNCQDEGCQAVVACGQTNGCSGSACYCGAGVEPLACAIFPGPSGPCINEIEAASGLVANGTCATKTCASALSMLSTTDPNNAVQRARALSVCTQGQRYAAATGVTPETPEIMGMCETECNL